MKQLGKPVPEIIEAVLEAVLVKATNGELSKPQTVAALEGADFVTFAPSVLLPN